MTRVEARGEWVLYLGTEDGMVLARVDTSPLLAPLGPAGKQVSAVVVDVDDADRLYIASRNDGLWRTQDGGRSWHEINRGVLHKDILSLIQDSASGVLYAGAEPTAIFRSTDRGDSWVNCPGIQSLEDSIHWTFPRPPHVAHVKNLAVRSDGSRLRQIYGAVEEGWLIRSLDDGESWETLKNGVPFDAHAVALPPDDPSVILVSSGAGVVRSDDGGQTFVRSDEGIRSGMTGGGYMSPLGLHPMRPSVVFAAASDVPPPVMRSRAEGADTRFYRSDDRGKTWRWLQGSGLPALLRGGPAACVVDAGDPNTVFFGLTDGSVWCTEDGGDSFRSIADGLPGRITGIAVARLQGNKVASGPAKVLAAV